MLIARFELGIASLVLSEESLRSFGMRNRFARFEWRIASLVLSEESLRSFWVWFSHFSCLEVTRSRLLDGRPVGRVDHVENENFGRFCCYPCLTFGPTLMDLEKLKFYTQNEWRWKLHSKRVKVKTTLKTSKDENNTQNEWRWKLHSKRLNVY